MRVAIYTLGCKVNQYETQAMEQELRRRGHELVDFEDSADAYIVNTCSGPHPDKTPAITSNTPQFFTIFI